MKTLTKSEEFIHSLGGIIEKACPELLEYDETSEEDFPTRKLFKLGSQVLSEMMIGRDSFGLKELDFKSMLTEYKRLKALKK